MITDWDDAYANGAYIDGAEGFPAFWQQKAAAFRQAHSPETLAYGSGAREKLDLFRPASTPAGLLVFVHGGYWMAFGRRDWSHLAAGALARGWAVAIPDYPLCPDVRIRDITRAVARAVTFAAERIGGPLVLTGHSAGGHLVARMGCCDLALPVAPRLQRIVPISGLHDLRPLRRTRMNETLRLGAAEAVTESPALCQPRAGLALHCVVGAQERPEFRRQSALLANIWTGAGIRTGNSELPKAHHFSVIEGLEDAQSPLCRRLFDPL